jgi:hypothetical protein
MSRDETIALQCLQKLEEIIRSNVADNGGRLIKFMGDGSMAEFPTALAAVSCAQRALSEITKHNSELPEIKRFHVRIGIHLGDVVEDKGDLFGDAVNIAARVQPLADPGGMALTDAVYSSVKNKISLHGTYLERTKLRNIPERVKIFLVPPPEIFYSLWYLRKRKPSLAIVTPIIFMFLAISGGWFVIKHREQNRLALLYVQSQDSNKGMAQIIEREINEYFGSLIGIEWIDRVGMMDIFSEVGVENLSAIEELETNACEVARRGGLDYSLIGSLKSLGENRWQLDSKIISTRTRSVVGTFSTTGSTVQSIVSNLKIQIQDWINENL